MTIVIREIRDVMVAMEENLAIPTTAEIMVMLQPTFQPYHHHQTIIAINQAVHPDHRAVAMREMDTAVEAVAEPDLPHPLFPLSRNHLRALHRLLSRWIHPLATAAVAETVLTKVKTETTIIVARAVAATTEEQVEGMMVMAVDIVEEEMVLTMETEEVAAGKEM